MWYECQEIVNETPENMLEMTVNVKLYGTTFEQTEKLDWLGQCCSEYNVLQNSTRERRCDSVLSPRSNWSPSSTAKRRKVTWALSTLGKTHNCCGQQVLLSSRSSSRS